MSRAKYVKNKVKPLYEATQLRFLDMLDLKTLSSTLIKNKNMNTENEKVNYLKIKCLRYEILSPGIIYYRYGYTGEYKIINVMGSHCRQITNHEPIDISKFKFLSVSIIFFCPNFCIYYLFNKCVL